ncbi:MAG TPA: cache domain-containing protein [Nitrospirota bacterium]|nr:cache domain-containing protein [Nitrospirota bacterium]
MFQRIIGALKQKKLLSPTGLVFALIIVLSLIIILGQFFHQSLQSEMANQFNKQQLLLSREVAMNIESFTDHVYKTIRAISQLPQIEQIDKNRQVRSTVDSITLSLQNEALLTIRVLDQNGIIRYDSAYPTKERADLSKTDYFQGTRILPKNERLITDLLETHDRGEDTKQFIIAVPIYTRHGNEGAQEFKGVVLAALSMDGLTSRFLAPIKSGRRGYAWMMDSDGTLLYHPTQPQMVGKNLYHSDKSCFACHVSFDTEKKMIEGKEETFGYYVAPGGENKLAAFYKLPIFHKSWIVVVSAPYSEVMELMRQSRLFYTLLITSIFITTLVASGATIVANKKKIMAEEKEKHLENHRRLEQEIVIAKEYLENIIENTRTNLMVLNKDLSIRTVNTAQAQTCGRPKEQVIGKSFFSLFTDQILPYNGIPIEEILRRTLDGKSYELRDYKITCWHDTPVFLTMNINPLLIDGTVPGILITSTDVTKRVQLEEALKKYTVELEDKVDRGTATAKKLEQQVLHSEKLAALGRLAAGVAHEIGNPLTSISTFAQLLRETTQDEFTQNSLDVINNHIQRITDIVRRMATFARADALNIREVQLNDVLNSTLDLMRLDKRLKSSVEIKVSLDPGLPKIMIDEGQMAQVFINIILNAFDAMPNGGELKVESRFGEDEHNNAAIIITFADSGTGIPQSELQKIFDPFFTTKEAGKGTGLGLSLSYDIVKRFKGDIRVESEVGKKTAFTIFLPINNGQS